MFSLHAIKNELLLTAANPLHWLPSHDVGPQAGSAECQAFGKLGAGTGAGTPVVHMHATTGKDSGTAAVEQISNKPLCGVTEVGSDSLLTLLFRVTAWLAVVLTIACIAKAAWTAFTRSGTGFGQAIKEVSTPLVIGAVLGAIYIVPVYILPLFGRFVVVVLESIGGLFN